MCPTDVIHIYIYILTYFNSVHFFSRYSAITQHAIVASNLSRAGFEDVSLASINTALCRGSMPPPQFIPDDVHDVAHENIDMMASIMPWQELLHP